MYLTVILGGQVVTLAVYIYLISSLIGRRSLNNGFLGDFDIFPILTFSEYFFYMGWLKVCRLHTRHDVEASSE